MDYDALIALSADKLNPGDWLPVLCDRQGSFYFALDIPGETPSNVTARTAQDKAIRLANTPIRAEGLYILHRYYDERVSVHLPGWRSPAGEWYYEKNYRSPLYTGTWDADPTAIAPLGPRGRLSALAARSMSLSSSPSL